MGKNRIYLGNINILPRTDLRWYFESGNDNIHKMIEGALKSQLRETFSLPPAENATSPTDLAIDVSIPFYTTGVCGILSAYLILIPIFRRPEIRLRCRLYNLESKKVLKVFVIKQRPSWREYFSHAFSWRTQFGSSPVFREEHMVILLNRASSRLLEQLSSMTRS